MIQRSATLLLLVTSVACGIGRLPTMHQTFALPLELPATGWQCVQYDEPILIGERRACRRFRADTTWSVLYSNRGAPLWQLVEVRGLHSVVEQLRARWSAKLDEALAVAPIECSPTPTGRTAGIVSESRKLWRTKAGAALLVESTVLVDTSLSVLTLVHAAVPLACDQAVRPLPTHD